MTNAPEFEISPYGEDGWIAQFQAIGDDIALALYANAAGDMLRGLKGVTDCVAGIDSLTLRYSPAAIAPENARDKLLKAIEQTPFAETPPPAKRLDIPVAYGGEFGPDFDHLCKENNLSAAQLIEAHASCAYRILMLGFAPGFAYLGSPQATLRAKRLDTPRQLVSAGSIGVASSFTGIYSLPSPGGWRIIGRTPTRLFDPKARAPFIFEPGAQVRFIPIRADQFEERAP